MADRVIRQYYRQARFSRGSAAQWALENPILYKGEPGFEEDTNRVKVGDGTTHWLDLPYVGGPTGPVGAQGPQGMVGLEGPEGPEGDTIMVPGPQGVAGTTGATGAQGPQGPAGAPGPFPQDGEDGETFMLPGPQGAQGATGSQGPTGPAGNVVFLSEDGEDGVTMPGPPGAQGGTGPAGPAGPQGPATGFLARDGEDGEGLIIVGPRGETGGTGATGAQGPAGTPGGPQGVPGPPGEDGEDAGLVPGPAGPAGTPGAAAEVVGADIPASSFAVNSLTYVDIVNDTANISAGDTIELQAEFVILNNSGASRIYSFQLTFGAQVIEVVATTQAASATSKGRYIVRGVFGVDSTTLWRIMMTDSFFGSAADNAPSSEPGTTADGQANFKSGATDETGSSKAVKLSVKSSSATATQTLELVSYRIRKIPTT